MAASSAAASEIENPGASPSHPVRAGAGSARLDDQLCEK
jgi:hypothetical protein